jgi:hypothetical protein
MFYAHELRAVFTTSETVYYILAVEAALAMRNFVAAAGAERP